jgi:Tol biopolymer transport system component/DNA-binding winged helix-turn-helix (wHTH) protein
MSNQINNLYEFGGFRFDAEGKTLWRGGEMILMPPKSLDLLALLLEKEGKIVSKQEILNTVWADTFVEEGVLTQNIYKLRNALGTDENGKQFIENIPRRGYRLTVPVKILRTDEVPVWLGEKPNEIFLEETSDYSTEPVFVAKKMPLVSSPETETRPKFNLRPAIFIGLGILLFAVTFGIYQFVYQTNEPKIAPIEQLKIQRLTDSGDVTFLAISPNAELLAFVRQEAQGESVWIKQIATGSSAQILPPSAKGYRAMGFSPDSRYLFIREAANPGAIYQTTAFAGGTLRKVAENVWSEFSVSPDGKQLAFIRRDLKRNAYLLIASNIDGSGEREISVRNSPLTYTNAFSWSPDGTKIAVVGDAPNLLIIGAADGKETELKTAEKPLRWRAISGAEWMPDGKRLIISARELNEPFSQLWLIDFPGGATRRLTNDLEAYFSGSLSADGKRLVARQQKIVSRLWLLPEGDLKNAKQLTFGERKLDGYGGVAWTPDGKIIFSHFADAENMTNLFQVNSDGGNRVQLTANAGRDNGYPTISGDGRYIVFTSNRSGRRQIWRMDIDGRNPKQLTLDEEKGANADFAALSPDGKEVFYIKRGAEPSAIWKVSLDGGTPSQVSRLKDAAAQNYLAISPDGKWLAYQHITDKTEAGDEDRSFIIGVIPTDGIGEPKLFNLPIRRRILQWAADSKSFYYIGGTFGSSSIWQQSLDGGEPNKVIEFPDRIFNFARSRDEKNLVVSRGRQQGDAILITNLPFE